MSTESVRGDGVGIEFADDVVRGVRLLPSVDGRVAAATELSIALHDDEAAVDTLVMLRGELGSPSSPTRLATFPPGAMMQRIDITGRGGPDLNTLRAKLQRLNNIDSTLIVEDGPRRWLLLIRWDSPAMRRLEHLAERAGFVDVAVEPSPLATARIAGRNASHITRLVAPGDAHHAVLSNRLPVCALGVDASASAAPDLHIGDLDVTLALFDDFQTDADLAVAMQRVREQSDEARVLDGRFDLELDLVGGIYPPFPDHDRRSPRRQAVALGAAVGAAGLAGPMRPVDMMITSTAVDDQFDRPWAIETLPAAAPPPPPPTAPPEPVPSKRRFRRR